MAPHRLGDPSAGLGTQTAGKYDKRRHVDGSEMTVVGHAIDDETQPAITKSQPLQTSRLLMYKPQASHVHPTGQHWFTSQTE